MALKALWGGSPAVTTLINSISLLESYSQDSEGQAEKETKAEERKAVNNSANTSSTSSDITERSEKRKRQKKSKSNPQICWKKRKFMKKNLSAHSRDQCFFKWH